VTRVGVPSLAKLNLDLRVLHKRADGFHELRTIFQTISLSDKLSIELEPARRTEIELASSVEIADNLVVRAARLVLDRLKFKARVRFALEKRIPMGAGLGGGSSNAASVLIALPALAGRRLPIEELVAMGEMLGSDVPFFLYGGTALGFGRGTELYPLPDAKAGSVLVVASGVHVSTGEAYRLLARETAGPLTSEAESPMLREFQRVIWNLSGSALAQIPLKNDFEGPVFRVHPELEKVVRKLNKAGAKPALMTGSGSAIWANFADDAARTRALASFPQNTVHAVKFVSRRQYRNRWRRALGSAAAASCFA
jgi:4-diphosphocytidyl-2-C-methyl-D-erythritol kinase